ncbi:hypothetical protein [Clostridium algidicarnis]|uniref:hypothetical protein n=1 Tax=Clostridium algidicarnis TaxID=37659 RepID=UPI001C0E0EB3|nr:hypothetical protein [Clostridium algidicarnis]MBU3194351.1 hypothetical protein [Clostridium algidicarnis]MBU3209680.1 hypothetical protein [Clostridium algidicarnis]
MQKILQFLNKLGGVMAADYVLKNNKIKESKNVMPSDSDSIDNIASIKGSRMTSLNPFHQVILRLRWSLLIRNTSAPES